MLLFFNSVKELRGKIYFNVQGIGYNARMFPTQ